MSDLDRTIENVKTNVTANFPPFRILVIGKRNSGKTTLLEKLCGGTVPIVRDQHGNVVSIGQVVRSEGGYKFPLPG